MFSVICGVVSGGQNDMKLERRWSVREARNTKEGEEKARGSKHVIYT